MYVSMGQAWATGGPWVFQLSCDEYWRNLGQVQNMAIDRMHLECLCKRSLTRKARTGAAGGDRTHDPWLRRPILYPLSYSRNSKKDQYSNCRMRAN